MFSATLLRRKRAAPTTVVTRIAAAGWRRTGLSFARRRDAGRPPSRAAAQIMRDAEVCKARKLARKPTTNRHSTGIAMPRPSCVVSVSNTGSATLPLVTAPRSGVARMIARLAYMTTRAMKLNEKMMALGKLVRGFLTSSAMEPALSKPTKEKPMKASATRNGPPIDR